ncbi:unnamed protein product, partial [Prorocentrum cordatum]
SKQIAAKPLNRYTSVLSLATAVAYVPLYGAVLGGLLRAGSVPRHQLDFVWRRGFVSVPLFAASGFALAALGDTLGDVIGMICTPYVAGPVHSLLSNCTPVFIALLAFCVLRQRYSLLQVLSLGGVVVAVVLGVLPSFSHSSEMAKATQPFFALVLAASCIFNAVSFVVKELVFKSYAGWLDREGTESSRSLHVFVVNFHAALFQLPFTLLTVPFNVLLGQTDGESIWQYMGEALTCVFGSSPASCGPKAVHAEDAAASVIVYVVFNVLWNISILISVKHSGALATFISLKAIFPVSTVLFACVDWPLLGRTPLSWLVWVSLGLMLPCIVLYQLASSWQRRRAEAHPSAATCCWPLRGRSS